MRSGVLLAAFLPLCGEPPAPTFTVVVCDRSTSATCDEDAIRAAVPYLLGEQAPPGSSIEVLLTGCGLDDVTTACTLTVPLSWGSGVARKQRAWREQEGARLASINFGEQRNCTAAAAAIWKAAAHLAERQGVTRKLVVISDLREVSAGVGLNLERRVPKPDVFVAALKRAGLVANLAGVEVVVCGVHDRSASAPWSARKAKALAEAWSAAFAAWNAPNVALRERCPWDEPAAPGSPVLP